MGEWRDLITPHVNRFRVGEKFDQTVSFNAVGCKNMADLLIEMADRLDSVIEERDAKKRRKQEKREMYRRAFEQWAFDVERPARRKVYKREIKKLYKLFRSGK